MPESTDPALNAPNPELLAATRDPAVPPTMPPDHTDPDGYAPNPTIVALDDTDDGEAPDPGPPGPNDSESFVINDHTDDGDDDMANDNRGSFIGPLLGWGFLALLLALAVLGVIAWVVNSIGGNIGDRVQNAVGDAIAPTERVVPASAPAQPAPVRSELDAGTSDVVEDEEVGFKQVFAGCSGNIGSAGGHLYCPFEDSQWRIPGGARDKAQDNAIYVVGAEGHFFSLTCFSLDQLQYQKRLKARHDRTGEWLRFPGTKTCPERHVMCGGNVHC